MSWVPSGDQIVRFFFDIVQFGGGKGEAGYPARPNLMSLHTSFEKLEEVWYGHMFLLNLPRCHFHEITRSNILNSNT